MNEINIMNTAISTDTKGRFSLNDLHKASGGDKKHQPANFLRLDQTQELISEITNENKLLTSEEFPIETKVILTSEHHLNHVDKVILRCEDHFIEPVSTIKGASEGVTQGTFVAWELVYAYAMWISPKFHLHVIRTFHNLQVEERRKLTCEIDRHKATLSEVANTATVLRERVDFLDSVVKSKPIKKGDRTDILCNAMDKGVRDYRKAVVVPHVKKVDRAVKGVRNIVTRLAAGGIIKGFERELIEGYLCEIEGVGTDMLVGTI